MMQRLSLCIDIDVTLSNEEQESVSGVREQKGTVRRGAREVISELYQIHYIHFVTAREEAQAAANINWLYRQQIVFDSLSLLGSNDKETRIRELEADFIIEGCYDHAIRLAEAGFHVLLLDNNSNQGLIIPNITRVYNWYHVKAAILRSLEQEAS